MKHQAEPVVYLWWLVSRAAGIVALVLVSLSVMIGLSMSTGALGRPGAKRILAKLHEHVAVTALLAIGGHGASLLGDRWLRPGFTGIAVPFATAYRPAFTGMGIIGGYLALMLGPSFYLRRRIGARRWRRLHSLIVVAWTLSVVHALGSGSDAQQLWLRVLVLAPAIPIAYLWMVRTFKPKPNRQRQSVGRAARVPRRPAGPEASSPVPRWSAQTELGLHPRGAPMTIAVDGSHGGGGASALELRCAAAGAQTPRLHDRRPDAQ